jgi:hypothetical protein
MNTTTALLNLVALISILFVSFYVTVLYYRNCKYTSSTLNYHGALEGNLTFFSLTAGLLGARADNDGAWLFGMPAIVLGAVVIRNFWRNWDRTDAQ